MKNRFRSFSFVLTLGALLGLMTWGSSLLAQDPVPQTQQPMPESQQPSQQQAPAQTPDASAQQTPQRQPDQTPSGQAGQSGPAEQSTSSTQAQSDSASGQTFTGTIVKQGDKYMLQDAASGTTYDIDHQDEVKKFEGKKVKVHGTLDSSGKKIMVQ
jgi:uncharacterized protein YdeI (BOF family)